MSKTRKTPRQKGGALENTYEDVRREFAEILESAHDLVSQIEKSIEMRGRTLGWHPLLTITDEQYRALSYLAAWINDPDDGIEYYSNILRRGQFPERLQEFEARAKDYRSDLAVTRRRLKL